jgi:hypothetical protein
MLSLRGNAPNAFGAALQTVKVFEVVVAEVTQVALAEWSESESDNTSVTRIGRTANEAGSLCPVDKSDRAVVFHDEGVGNVAHGGSAFVGVGSDRE